MTIREQIMSNTYTALLALPDGRMANDAATRIPGAQVIDNVQAGVWLCWTADAEDDKAGVDLLQEMRLRAEMFPEFAEGGVTASGSDPTLFQTTPFLVLQGACTVIHTEEVLCL
jgi:hypothetical protein